MMIATNVLMNLEIALPASVTGRRPAVYPVVGWIVGPAKTRSLSIQVGEETFDAVCVHIPRTDVWRSLPPESGRHFAVYSGFTAFVTLGGADGPLSKPVRIRAAFADGSCWTKDLEPVEFEACVPPEAPLPPPAAGDSPGVMICMATCNPDPARFESQIESLRRQTHANWRCIVSDDASSPQPLAMIRRTLGSDGRFFLVPGERSVGRCASFQRALELVPEGVDFVALCGDQDRWHPEKIEACLARFDAKTSLVFCDMRVLDRNGLATRDASGPNRKNYYHSHDIDLLSVANTIDAAASLFRRNLLDVLLPLPINAKLEVAPDHWLAVVAALRGKIRFVAKPLLDRVQPRNAEGDGGRAEPTGNSQRVGLLSRMLGPFRPRRILSSLRTRPALKERIKTKIRQWHDSLAVGVQLYNRSALLLATAKARCPDSPHLNRLGRPLSAAGTTVCRLQVSARRMGDPAGKLLSSLLLLHLVLQSSKYSGLLGPLLRRLHRVRFPRSNSAGRDGLLFPSLAADQGIVEFLRKYSGREYRVRPTTPVRVNVLIGMLSSQYMTGGIFAMLHLARRFEELGLRTRILLSDMRAVDSLEMDRIRRHAPDLEAFLGTVEMAPFFSTNFPISISPQDLFVATSWWTAYLCAEAIAHTAHPRFLYLSQDYEPVFYAHGSYRVLAENSYRLPCHLLCSTELLRNYLLAQKKISPDAACEYFTNPILTFAPARRPLGPKKLLFYARSQPCHERNLYPLGMLAIDQLVRNNPAMAGEWEFFGIGDEAGEQRLPCGVALRHLGKFDLKTYHAILPQYDLGLAIMDSPHPGLMPQEMAAAGLMVVTNTYYHHKTADFYRAICPNILAVDPTPDRLAEALAQQARHVEDWDRRLQTPVHWPRSWSGALPDAMLRRLLDAVTGGRPIPDPTLATRS
jgi:hypothetical protein